ncbi:MAG: hypothetical protein FD152_1105 [Xanthobacteraceae bacterium]|nr:MAG: hypothetical protein FD152_1105 [Xanthobacteraceae bacterium]
MLGVAQGRRINAESSRRPGKASFSSRATKRAKTVVIDTVTIV